MWRKVETLEDSIRFVEIKCLGDEIVYYYAKTKQVQSKAEELFGLLENPLYQAWIYEDGLKFIALSIEKYQNGTGRIHSCVPAGFGQTVFENVKNSIPVILDKFREILDTLNIQKCFTLSPRTPLGECMAYFCETYMWELESNDLVKSKRWHIAINRDHSKKPEDENLYKVQRTSNVDADEVPDGHVPKDLKVKNVSKSI